VLKFKEPHFESQYNSRPPKLRSACADFVELAEKMGIDAVVTRVTDPVSGESGVHPAGRACDFRDEYAPGKFLFTSEQVKIILDFLNEHYPRKDGLKTAIHHCFCGGPFHFHIQTAAGDP
jgi:hypothetical protein